ncbi:Ger(x)C family spore germination protein [Haloimpatiens sp. FM7330]|uniref:Ger(x)C family spore germination protein n=1 Tax=Haloimpatiens sp. FM7330 TaxID=3298610 RepID=UPI00362D30DF
MTKILKKILISMLIMLIPINMCGCWDYAEINDLDFIAGIAIDKEENTNKYIMTMEILEPSYDQKTLRSRIVESKGKTIHEAFRNSLNEIGKMVEVSHAKVIIISKKIAEQGIIPVIDLAERDVDVRVDTWIAVSSMDTAGEIFKSVQEEERIISYKLDKVFRSQSEIGKYVDMKLYQFIEELSKEGISPILPNVKASFDNGKKVSKVEGTSVFKKDRIVGYLNEDESIYLSMLKNKKLKNIIAIKEENGMNISLEILSVNRKINPIIKDGRLAMKIDVDLDVVLSEIQGSKPDYLQEKGRGKIKEDAEKMITCNIDKLIKKVQKQYKSDIFGFGEIIKQEQPNEWKKIHTQWDKIFPNLDTDITVNVNIKGSGLFNKQIQIGE